MKRKYLLAAIGIALGACGGGGSDDGDDGNANTDGAFPSDLAVTSPLKLSAAAQKTRSVTPFSMLSYDEMVAKIAALLSGSETLATAFDANMFLQRPGNATCFGPTMDYTDYPGAVTGQEDGQLPSGDLGIWKETEGSTTEACAAAQLNAQMQGVSNNASMALVALAGMLKVAADNAVVPTAGSSTDLTDELNALGLPNLSFDSAVISRSTSGDWSYTLEFTYTSGGVAHPMEVNMLHHPGSSSTDYEGLLTYRVEDDFVGGHCGGDTETHNGSLHYVRHSASDLRFQVRYGMFCGDLATSTNGLTEAVSSTAISGNVVNPDLSWANNFSVFTADFDPDTQAGGYTYAWQAGSGDGHTRVLMVNLNDNAPMDGEAYYGFGESVQTTTDSGIEGFFCSWAGPSPTHTLQTHFAQRQFMTFDSTAGVFTVPSGGSDITYAPTDSCTYDGSGTFWYDRDLDTTTNETSTDINVATPDLLDSTSYPTTDTDSDGTIDVMDSILGRGYTPPSYP